MTIKKKKKLRYRESNPGHLRDRQRCYQLHHTGFVIFCGASNEDRTRDLALTKRMLCQLSYRGERRKLSEQLAKTVNFPQDVPQCVFESAAKRECKDLEALEGPARRAWSSWS